MQAVGSKSRLAHEKKAVVWVGNMGPVRAPCQVNCVRRSKQRAEHHPAEDQMDDDVHACRRRWSDASLTSFPMGTFFVFFCCTCFTLCVLALCFLGHFYFLHACPSAFASTQMGSTKAAWSHAPRYSQVNHVQIRVKNLRSQQRPLEMTFLLSI